MKAAVRHGLAAGLVALGLTLTLMGSVGLASHMPLATAVALGVVLALAAASVRKLLLAAVQAILLAAAGVYLAAMGGLDAVTEVLRAATLTFTGVRGAMPMVAAETALLLGVAAGMAAFWVSWPWLGAYPAACLTVICAALIWLTDQPQLLWYLLPAVAGCLLLAMLGRSEEIALRRALPMALMLALIGFGAAGGGGVTVQPLKDAADDLRQRILDYFFYTEPRNVFSLADEGYYPQGNAQLGGAATPTDHPVMVVETPRTAYLRGSIRNCYTGRVWVDLIGDKRYLWMHPQWSATRTDVYDMARPEGVAGAEALLTPERISVRMLDGSASSLFVPQRVQELAVGGDMVPYFNQASETFITRDLQAGDTYTVTAPLVKAGDDGLSMVLAHCAMQEDPHYDRMVEDYTALPSHMQQEIYDLAQQACAGQETPYGKALALQRYLASDYTYSLEVDPTPENIDFVTHFLLSAREGYCTHFASAMTVMCRMIGLPARYVEGYLAEPDASGTALVTGLQGHAWTEVYFAGYGWLTFDATPGRNRGPEEQQTPTDTPPEEDEDQPEDEPENEPEDEPEDEPENEPGDEPTPPPQPEDDPAPTPSPEPEDDRLPEDDGEDPEAAEDPADLTWLWWLLLVLAVIAAVTLRILCTRPERCAGRAKDEMGRWSAWMQAVTDALAVCGLKRESSESPMAFAARVDALRRFPAEMTPLGECMALVFYGRMEPEPGETAMTAEAFAQLLPSLTLLQRVRLTLLRAFTPAKKRDFTKPHA